MGERGLQWSVGYRFIGFEKDTDSLGEGPPRACWIICAPVPICVAVDVQSGATANSTLEVSTQQGCVDERKPLSATTQTDEVQASDNSLNKDEQDATTNLPQEARVNPTKRSQQQMDETQKRVVGVTAYPRLAASNITIITSARRTARCIDWKTGPRVCYTG